MTVTDDPIGQTGEKLAGYMTVALTGAARVAEVLAYRRAQQLRRAEAEGRHAAEMMREQQKAELAMVRHQTREAINRPEWWNSATPEQVADAYATARAYGRLDPEVAGMARHMEAQIGARYGVDADALVGDVERSAAARRAAAERGTAWALTAEADAVDAAVHADGRVDAHEAAHDVPFVHTGWDEAARRETLAARLDAAGIDGDARTGRIVADRLQGAPAAAAPAAPAARRAPKARNIPAKGAERGIGR
jgi:hypothetical protein